MKQELSKWLCYNYGNNKIQYDYVQVTYNKIINYLNSNNLKLNVPEDIFKMYLIRFLYNNSL